MKVQMRVELRNESQQLMVERTKQIAKGQFRPYKELRDRFSERQAQIHLTEAREYELRMHNQRIEDVV